MYVCNEFINAFGGSKNCRAIQLDALRNWKKYFIGIDKDSKYSPNALKNMYIIIKPSEELHNIKRI